MPKVKKKEDKDKKITVVAELTVSSAYGDEVIKSFDKAWHRVLELAREVRPVSAKFNGFVRIDED